ncbi:L-aspartate oxidase [Rhodovulum strictum]|uniref:L-aspartate oxidase n=1 Tax=Rhodovulum strictum TaxID=58314 RepID=A0A844BGW5_9RHOB|nr:L-aspartate oxidase [Rhodovulum strictum]
MSDGVRTARVVILGAGIAGLSAALALAPRPVLVVSPAPLGEGTGSAWAQGGVAAAMGAGDSPEAHAADTVRAGAGTVDAEIARQVTAAAPARIAELTDLGVPFDRDGEGGYRLGLEAAHSAARIVRVMGDQAGGAIMARLIAAVRAAPSIQLVEGVRALRLHVVAGRVRGVWLARADGAPTRPVLLRCPAVLLAGGGAAGLFALTTNPPQIRGEALGMAARAGAVVADAEFVQFHPTAIDTGGPVAALATEALRGEGAVLRGADGHRFMPEIHPDAELAPRDVVARAVLAQIRAGNRPVLDTRDALGARLKDEFPAVHAACLRAGIDPLRQPIPVAPAAHYHMGGVASCLSGQSSLPGLWVAGETAATGLHGANRLASNGLLEALVLGRAAAADLAAHAGPVGADFAPPVVLDWADDPTRRTTDADEAALRQLMTDHVGVLRDAEGLRHALAGIAALEAACPGDERFLNMTAAATLIAAAALLREESRGGHFRTDFPAPDPRLAHIRRLTLDQARSIRRQSLKVPA